MRPLCLVPVWICASLLALAPAGAVDPGGDAAGAAAEHLRYVTSGGAIFEWDGSAPQVVSIGRRGDLIASPGTAALVPYDDGDSLLALRVNPDAASRIRHRLEGVAMTFDLTGTAPALRVQVPFDGEPTAGVVSPDGTMAYVLARRLVPGDDASNKYWVHEIDLVAGRLLGSSQMSHAPHGLALEPGGRRLFVTLDDRVQALSTRPVVFSWHYRSPGPNGAVTVRPGTSTLCVLRGEEVALFDPAAIAARTDTTRHGLDDDASSIIRMPFAGLSLDLSEDGRLAAVRGPDRIVFVDCQTQALIWPSETPGGLKSAADVRALSFPGAGLDLVLALFPGGQVAALQTPAPPGLPSPAVRAAQPGSALQVGEPIGGTTPGVATPESSPPPQSPPIEVATSSAALTTPLVSPTDSSHVGVAQTATPQPGPAQAAPPQSAPPQPEPKPVAAAAPPEPPTNDATSDQAAKSDAEAFLEGKITGAMALVKAVVIYGPNSIVREYRRVATGSDGTWRTPLPPPGSYRIVPVGDGSTPIPAAPGFLTIQVTKGEGRSGIDFSIHAVN